MKDLRVRLGFILALALMPLLIFSVSKSYSDFNRDRTLLRSNTDLTARMALTEIVSSFEVTRSLLKFKSTLLPQEDCSSDLQRLTSEYPQFYNLVQADSITGQIICSAKPVKSDRIDFKSFSDSVSPKQPFHTEIIDGTSADGEPGKVLITVYADFNNDKITGYYAAVEDINYFPALLKKSKISDQNELALIDGNAGKLAGDLSEANFEGLKEAFKARSMDDNRSYYDAEGRPILILSTPADNIYLAVASRNGSNENLQTFNPFTYAALPVFAWLFGFAAIWLSTDQLILIHLRRMRAATMRFANGDRKVRVGPLNNAPDSIRALGSNFDKMADRIAEREAIISDSLDEKEALLREIHHRVKNNLQIIISLLNMQERKLTDKDGLAAITDTRSRINAIALVHRGLYESADLRVVDMQKFLDRLLPELTIALGLEEKDITVTSLAQCEPMEADTATPVALFVVEALTNATKHGVSRGGKVAINILQDGKEATVSIADDGKTVTDINAMGNGTGMKLMRGFARQLGGSLGKRVDENGYEVSIKFSPRSAKKLV